jgi:mannose-P-dolichol utilization defect protein 1
MVITLLILYYAPLPRLQRVLPVSLRPPRARVAAAAVIMLLFSLALASPTLVPPGALAVLQATTIPVSLASKVPQMQELARRKETGQLSAVVVFAQLAGTVARV